MSRKCPLVVVLLALILQGSVAFAGTGLSRAWVKNLGEEPAHVAVEYGSRCAAGVGEIVLAPGEMSELGEGDVARSTQPRTGPGLLVIHSDAAWSPAALRVEPSPAIRMEKKGGRPVSRYAPKGWAADLSVAMGFQLTAGQSGRATLRPGSAPALAVALLDADSAVDIVLRDAKGETMRTLALSATQPTRLRLDLGGLGPLAGSAQIDLRVSRGRAAAATNDGKGPRPVFNKPMNKGISGSASFSQTVNYNGTLYYYVSGGPANTCGELDTYRNGSWLYSPGWLCTDNYGDATMGPWYAYNYTNQTDEPAYIRWPNNDTTNNATHVWDNVCAYSYVDSASGTPPTNYYGHATDATWGAGFDFGTSPSSYFHDTTANTYWTVGSSTYNTGTWSFVTTYLSRVNRWYVNWSVAGFPPSTAHVSGHSYEWVTCVDDGSTGCCSTLSFTMP
jgi:hypothetical protein